MSSMLPSHVQPWISWFNWEPRCHHPCAAMDQLMYLSSKVSTPTCSHSNSHVYPCISWFTWAPRCHLPRVAMDQMIYLSCKVPSPTCSHGSADFPELQCAINHVQSWIRWFTWAARCHLPRVAMDQLIFLSSNVPSFNQPRAVMDQMIYLSCNVLSSTCRLYRSADLPELVSPTYSHGLADLPEL